MSSETMERAFQERMENLPWEEAAVNLQDVKSMSRKCRPGGTKASSQRRN
jgi:hypothetical protein